MIIFHSYPINPKTQSKRDEATDTDIRSINATGWMIFISISFDYFSSCFIQELYVNARVGDPIQEEGEYLRACLHTRYLEKTVTSQLRP